MGAKHFAVRERERRSFRGRGCAMARMSSTGNVSMLILDLGRDGKGSSELK